jgi:hypothetical protein
VAEVKCKLNRPTGIKPYLTHGKNQICALPYYFLMLPGKNNTALLFRAQGQEVKVELLSQKEGNIP